MFARACGSGESGRTAFTKARCMGSRNDALYGSRSEPAIAAGTSRAAERSLNEYDRGVSASGFGNTWRVRLVMIPTVPSDPKNAGFRFAYATERSAKRSAVRTTSPLGRTTSMSSTRSRASPYLHEPMPTPPVANHPPIVEARGPSGGMGSDTPPAGTMSHKYLPGPPARQV